MLKLTTKTKNILIFVALISIFLIAIFFRFYNVPFRYGLGDETVRDAIVGIEGARELQLPLTGAFSSAGPFTFGPWYYYQLIFASLVLPNNYAPWIYLGIASVMYVFVIFKVGERLEGRFFGLLLACLAAISPALIISATHLTVQNLTNLYAILAIWLFISLAKGKIFYLKSFLFGSILGISVNLHYQMAGFLILPIILVVVNKRYKLFLLTMLGFTLTFLPLLFFELNNHWYTVRNFTQFLLHGKETLYVPNRWLFYVRDFWPAFWADVLGSPVWIATVFLVGFGGLVFYIQRTKGLTRELTLLLIAFLVEFILLRYYWGPRYFGYLNFMRPFVFLFTGYILLHLFRFKPLVGIVALSLLVAAILPKSVDRLAPDPFTQKMYESVAKIETHYPQHKLSLYECWYESSYQAEVKSLVFLLDMHHKLDSNGKKLGVMDKNCRFPAQFTPHEVVSFHENLVDFSSMTDQALREAKWNQTTFTSVYRATVHWWFDEKP